jgi:hypothetical protein
MALDEAFEFACSFHVKKYHRDQQIRFVKKADPDAPATRYSGPRSARNVLAVYSDRHSKVTGEVYCLHFDWRIKGADALRRAGFHSIADLKHIDRREFWQTRLLFRAIDPDALGRRCNNHIHGTNRRRPWITQCGPITYNYDRSTAGILWHSLGSTQAIIDECEFNVKSCLIPILVDHLLPEHTLSYDYPSKPVSIQTCFWLHKPLSCLQTTYFRTSPKLKSSTIRGVGGSKGRCFRSSWASQAARNEHWKDNRLAGG